MKNNKKDSFYTLPPDIKKISIPIISLIGIATCFFITLKIGLGKISAQKNEVNKIEKNITVLKNKQNILSQVKNTLENDIKFFSLAFPDSNPSLSVIYQIKTISSQYGLLLENIKSGSESKEKDYSKVDIIFDVTGDLVGILKFLETLRNTSPIVTVEKIEINQTSGFFTGTVGLRGYWADFPKKIPAISQAIADFSENELEIISNISKLLVPPFSNVLPTQPSGRENPFE